MKSLVPHVLYSLREMKLCSVLLGVDSITRRGLFTEVSQCVVDHKLSFIKSCFIMSLISPWPSFE